MEQKIKISSGALWEDIVGYSRAVRIGKLIEVSGTASIDKDSVMFPGDAYEQTKFVIKKIEQAIIQAGGKLDDVIRTRIYVTDISQWELIGKAHGDFFLKIKPATSIIEVKSLIDARFLVEIEATAVIAEK